MSLRLATGSNMWPRFLGALGLLTLSACQAPAILGKDDPASIQHDCPGSHPCPMGYDCPPYANPAGKCEAHLDSYRPRDAGAPDAP